MAAPRSSIPRPLGASTPRSRWQARPTLFPVLALSVAAFGCAADDPATTPAASAADADDATEADAVTDTGTDADADTDAGADTDHDGHAEISVEPLTSPSTFTDDVSLELDVDFDGYGSETRDLADASNILVAEVTIPPGAVFPWHTHPGPVLLTIAEGDFVYRLAEDCEDRTYVAGEALVDPGDGVIHTAYNPSDSTTTVIATFLGAPDGEELTVPVDGPDPDTCALPSP